jgi:RNA polymerase sigma-70 factor, ECF subfamily
MGDQLKKIADERDAGAFQALFLTFWPKVRAMLMRQGTDKQTAEEIAQETMLAVWSKSHRFSSERGNVAAWIYGIARNLRIDRVRRQAAWQRYYDEHETMTRIATSAEAPALCDQNRPELARALGALPRDQFEVIQLSFIEGLSQSEIAARLNVPLGTVKSRMRLAVDKLRVTAERVP